MQRLKAVIVDLDYESGVINSQRQSFWRTPFKMSLRVSRINDDHCSVYVESDAVLSTILFDFGSNRRRVRHFIDDLTT